MKIHIYQGPGDKIKASEIPFYKNDKMDIYKQAEEYYNMRSCKYSDIFDASDLGKVDFKDMDERQKTMFSRMGENYGITELLNEFKEFTIYTTQSNANLNMFLFIKCTEEINGDKKELYVLQFIPIGITSRRLEYEGFIDLCNKKFKEEGYDKVYYYFQVAHFKRPDIKKYEYDRVVRVGQSLDNMGYRVYIKNLKQTN